MRRVSTFTRAILSLLTAGWVVAGAWSSQVSGQAPPQTPTSKPITSQAVAQCPDDLDPVLEQAQAHALRQDWSAVEKLLSPLESKLDADGLVLLSKAHSATRHPIRAGSVLQRGLQHRPDSEILWLALIDHALDLRQCGLALQRVNQAQRRLGPTPPLQFRAARAYYRLGQVLGRTRVISVPGGRAGQFINDWLLIEKRDEPNRFLCCPPTSAIYTLRRALDAGLNEPAAHRLHARIWKAAGRPEIGLAILQSREAQWLENASTETLATFAEIALAANALDDFLRYARLHADHEPQRRAEILFDASVAAAERYNQRGDETMSRAFLRRALTLRPENVEVMLQLADADWEAGACEEAVMLYRRVLERKPAHPDSRRILERLSE